MKDKKKIKPSHASEICSIIIVVTYFAIMLPGAFLGEKIAKDVTTYDVGLRQEMRIYENNVDRKLLRLPTSVYILNETEEYIAIASEETGIYEFGHVGNYDYRVRIGAEKVEEGYVLLEDKPDKIIFTAFILMVLIAAAAGMLGMRALLKKFFPKAFLQK